MSKTTSHTAAGGFTSVCPCGMVGAALVCTLSFEVCLVDRSNRSLPRYFGGPHQLHTHFLARVLSHRATKQSRDCIVGFSTHNPRRSNFQRSIRMVYRERNASRDPTTARVGHSRHHFRCTSRECKSRSGIRVDDL